MLDGASPPPPPATPPPAEPLALQRELERAWGVLMLKPERMLQATTARDAVEVAIVFLLTSAILSYIGGVMYPFELDGKAWELSVLSRAVTVLTQLAITVGIIAFLASAARFFRAPITFGQLFRVLGYAAIVFCATIIPSMTIFAFAWWFAVAYVALRALGQLDADRSLLVVLLGVILLFVSSRIVVELGVYLWFGRWAVIGFFA